MLRQTDGVYYNSATHEYWEPKPWGRRDYVSVTQACHEGGLADEYAVGRYTEDSRDRGTALHDGLLFHFTFDAQPDLDPAHEPYWTQIMNFLLHSGFVCERAEEMIVDPVYAYAGHFDFFGVLPQFSANDNARDLVDLKTGSIPSTVGCQTMGYRRRLGYRGLVRRWVLNVTETGYAFQPINLDPKTGRFLAERDRADESLFLAAVQVAHHRRTRIRSTHHGGRVSL